MIQLTRFIALAVVFGMVGCGGNKPPAYANVSGTVTYNGKPLASGIITFTSTGSGPTSADIVDGNFAGQALVGSNKIQASAYRKRTTETKLPETARKQVQAYKQMYKGTGAGTADQFNQDMEDYMPAEWGSESKQTRVVEAGAPNSFQFLIKGK